MNQAFVSINGVPTKVMTWGHWIESSLEEDQKDIILCIPGNPGISGYYSEFLTTLHERVNKPIWIVNHAGHESRDVEYHGVPALEDNEDLYGLEGQINHKIEFIRKYVPEGSRLFLIGHSIGAYVILQLLKHPDIKAKVVKSYLLFPTIERMAETNSGKILNKLVRPFVSFIVFMAWIFTLLPQLIQTVLVKIYFTLFSIPFSNMEPTLQLITPETLKKVFYMAFEEMDYVCDIDSDLIEANKDTLKLYYGSTDHWAPVSYCVRFRQNYPDVDAEICQRKFEHAFVLRRSKEVGHMVADWIDTRA